MIYLIGGPPKCGKTTLAKRLSRSTNTPWVSTDTLQNVIKPYIPEQDFAVKFPSSSMRYGSNDEKYTKHSAIEIINAYRQQAKTVYAAIDAFIASEIIDGNDYIVEGFHVEPDLINRLETKFPHKIRGVLVIKKDTTAFIESINKSTTPNDWIRHKTKDDSTFFKIAKMVAEYSTELESEANHQGIKVFNADQNFEEQMKSAEMYLTNS